MAGISPEAVEQVRQASDIVEIIGQYVALKRSGAKYKALSPFNKEKTPSFYVDPGRQIFKCFSSGHGGDVFEFLKRYENLTFPEAVRRLAQRAGIPLAEESRQNAAQRSQREDLLALHAGLARHWQKLLWNDPAAEVARNYLAGREFPQTLAEEFGLGFAPPGWNMTSAWAQQNGYQRETLDAAKLVATNEQGRYDFFRERLMIPIHDESGQIVAFSGRLLDPAAKAQKYLNSHESPIFQKSRVLFGLHKNKRAIITTGSAIVCEGQIDLMRCWQAGIKNVVAPQGTAFTDVQARALKRLAPEVIVCFDADRAGRDATRKAIDRLVREGLRIRVARIPSGEDPDSLLRRQPAEVFLQIITEAKDHTRYLLDLACEAAGELSSPRAKGAIAAEIAPVISAIPNEVQRESFLLEVARRLQVPRDLIEKERYRFEAQQKQRPPTPATEIETAAAEPPSEDVVEPWQVDRLVEEFVSFLLLYPDEAAPIAQRLRPEWASDLAGSEILHELLAAHAQDDWVSPVAHLERVDERTRRYLTQLMVNPVPLSQAITLAEYRGSLLLMAEHRWKQRQMLLCKQEIESGLLGPGELAEKFKELLDLKRPL